MKCNIVVQTVNELSACITTQEVAAIPVPDKIGVVGFEGMAIFVPAPALRNAILASNTQNPLELIPLMSATARAFDVAHANNGNMICKAITCSDDLNAWLCSVKQGLINKMRYSVIPEDDEVAQFNTNGQLQCISNRAQVLAVGGGIVANNDAVLQQLTAAISAQNKATNESNNLRRNEIQRQLMKDESKKDQSKKTHLNILKKISRASAATSNDKNKSLTATFTCFVNCDNVGKA
jgi:hypothetical protein